MDADNDVPQAKASRQEKKVSHEYCQGYVDKNGMWNNGFYCRRWGGPDETYCCGDGRERFCCPEQTSATSQATSTSAASLIPIIVGVSVGLVVVIICLLIGCFLCPSCPGFKRRRRNKAPVPIVIGRTLSVSMEAEATSAVIAAQALVPLQQQHQSACSSSSPSGGGGGQGSSTTTVGSTADDGHLHCGCRWTSPNDTSSTTVDIDSLVASLYQSTTSAWQPELDNFYNYSCEVRPSCSSRDATLRKEALRQQQHHHQHQQQQQHQQQASCSRLQQASSRLNSHRLMGSNHQSPALCIQSYRTNSSSATRDSSEDESKQTSLERDNKTHHHQQPSSLRRTYGLPEHIRSAGGSTGGGGGGGTGRDTGGPSGAMLLESDRQRRDSGVLVEDQDTTGSGNSMLALNIPAIELTSITRQLNYNSLDRRTTAVVRQH